MRIRTLSLWRQIIFLPRHGARYMYWQQSGPFCLRKPGLEMYLSLWIIWFLYWWGFSQHGLKNGILHGWQEARENSIFSCLLLFSNVISLILCFMRSDYRYTGWSFSLHFHRFLPLLLCIFLFTHFPVYQASPSLISLAYTSLLLPYESDRYIDFVFINPVVDHNSLRNFFLKTLLY